MKLSKLAALPLAAAIGVFSIVSISNADTTVSTTKTTTYRGTVSDINAGSSTMILRSDSSPTPVTYTFTPQTVFVDATGNTIAVDTIKTKPVNIEYITEGDKTVVRRVTVIKE